MNEMIERVVRAIIESLNDSMDPHVRPLTYEEVINDSRHGIVQAAKAAIVAMREPTDEMIRVGSAIIVTDDISQAEFTWQRMVDAALEE